MMNRARRYNPIRRTIGRSVGYQMRGMKFSKAGDDIIFWTMVIVVLLTIAGGLIK